MSILFSGGRQTDGPRSWEPESLELPLIVPCPSRPARKAPHLDTDDEESPEESTSRVIVIDLA
jgi:hypothetical protein